MKAQILKTVLATIVVLSASCSKDDDVPVMEPEDSGITLYEKQGAWICTVSETCEDVYQFEFKAGSRISIGIEEITGKSVVSLDFFAEFGEFGGPNLLTNGGNTYHNCTGQDENISLTNLLISTEGIYNLAVARDWGKSAGADGTYSLTIISDTPFIETEVPLDDTEALNYDSECL